MTTTPTTRLDECKLLLGVTSKDDLLNLLIAQTEDFISDYTHQEIENISPNIIDEIVVYRFNLLGSEGLNSESYSGMSFNYIQDLPTHIYKQLNKLRKVIFR